MGFLSDLLRFRNAAPMVEVASPPSVQIVPRRRQPENAVDPATLPTGTPPTPFGTGSNGLRSNVTFMPLQLLQEMRQRDRLESVRTSRYLDNRVGLFTALNENSVTGAVGAGIMGYSATGDQAFDDSADKFVDSIMESPEFDVTGEHHFYDLQEIASRAFIVDGDCGGAKILLRDDQGRIIGTPQVQLFTTDQIGNAGIEAPDSGWNQGILRSEVGRALRYRILKKPLPGVKNARRYFDYEARDFMFMLDRRRIGLGRGMPWSHQGQDNGLAMLDLDALEKAAQYVNAFFAMWLESPNGDTPEALEQLITTQLQQQTTDDVSGSTVTQTAKQVTQRFLNMFGGGAIPVFAPGQSLKSFKADREGSIKSGYMTWLSQQAAIGYRMPPALVWIVAGGNTGPDNRVFLTQASTYFRRIMRIVVSRFAKPARDWVLLYGLLTGRINGGRMPANGADYRTCRWVGPRDMTIDERYFHKTWAERIDAGLGTEEEYFALQGLDADPQARKRIKEIRKRMDMCAEEGVPYAEYRRSMPGQNSGIDPALVDAAAQAAAAQASA